MPLQYPKRDGFLYDLCSVKVREGAALWAGLTKIQWGGEMDGAGVHYANGILPAGHIRGRAKPNVELTFLAEAWFDFYRDHTGILIGLFPTVVVENQEGSRIDMIKLVSLRFTSVDAPSEGTDPNEITKPANALDVLIKPDGATAYTSIFTGKQDGEA